MNPTGDGGSISRWPIMLSVVGLELDSRTTTLLEVLRTFLSSNPRPARYFENKYQATPSQFTPHVSFGRRDSVGTWYRVQLKVPAIPREGTMCAVFHTPPRMRCSMRLPRLIAFYRQIQSFRNPVRCEDVRG